MLHCIVIFMDLFVVNRADSVIESSLRGPSSSFAFINLNLNFCETTIYNKVFLENLVAVH